MQELADKVWTNARFHYAAKAIERCWLTNELKLENVRPITEESAIRAISAAAILACSERLEHRAAAHRLATYVFELFELSNLPFDGALRVILARLGNFPAIQTRNSIYTALPALPWILAAEEIAEADRCTVQVCGKFDLLTEFQANLWRDFNRRYPVAFSTPTSGGKSFLLQLYVASLFDDPGSKRVVYLVPSRALITQVSGDLIKLFQTRDRAVPEIATVPLGADTSPPDRIIYVMTQERVHLTLQSNPSLKVNLIIVDEAHSISDGARGILLQSVIEGLISRNENAQVLFASPITRNLDIFGRLFNLAHVSRQRSREPTVSQNFLIVGLASTGNLAIRVIRETGRSSLLGEVPTDLSLRSNIDKLAHIPLALCAGQSNVIYANGADDAELIALRVASQVRESPQSSRLLSLAKLAKETVHAKYVLADCVLKGVGFHYSNIPTKLRQEIQNAVSDGSIKYLVCTSTLLQGVNLPAKNLFMLKPTKGRGSALESVDFWNLAGRAGRLRREFQGNIFLIDYNYWSKKPLTEPKDTNITPAIEKSIKSAPNDLIAAIEGKGISGTQRKRMDVESAFVRLLDDYRSRRLERTFEQLEVSDTDRSILTSALGQAAALISLPSAVLRRTHSVSAHKQQKLYSRLRAAILANPNNIDRLIPLHPRERNAFNSYADVLQLCHEVILGIDISKKLHRYHALMAQRWMLGWSVPRIVSAQIKRRKGSDVRKIIRETLEMIEEVIRFQTSRLFGCYNSILGFALSEIGEARLSEQIPNMELFLEIGASNQTMVNLIALGLSRAVAIRLNGARLPTEPELGIEDAMRWLQSQSASLETLGLSPLQIEEVRSVLNDG